MSIRTIIEINHDYLGRLTEVEAMALRNFINALGGTLDAAKLSAPQGIRVLRQRHHSEKVVLEVE